MAVTVADTLAAKNNLDFPIVDGNDVKGGCHCVEDNAAMNKIIGSQKAQAGMLVFVKNDNGSSKSKTYQLNDAMDTFTPFGGDLTTEQMQSIMDYVNKNIEHSKVEDVDGTTYLTLL